MPTNAKNIKFDQPGAGVYGYGITEKNLIPTLEKLYSHKTEKAGGSKVVFDAVYKNAEKAFARQPKSKAAKEFFNWTRTGKLPTTISPSFMQGAGINYDYGLREAGRNQQHKKSFFTSTFGKILHAVGTVALGAIPVVGPALAVLAGGIGGAVNGGGVLGGLTGALSGYGAGQFGSSLAGAVNTTGGLASSFSNPGTFAHNLWNGSNILGGTVTNVNSLMPGSAMTGAHIGSNAAGLLGPVQGGGNLFNSFTNTINGAKGSLNTATGGLSGTIGDTASGIGKIQNIFGGGGMAGNTNSGTTGGLFNTLFGASGSNKASKKLVEQLMQLYDQSKVSPFNINNPNYVGANVTANGANPVLNPNVANTFGNFNTMINKLGAAGSKLNPMGLSQQFFDQIDRLESRRDADKMNSLESRLFNSSGINQGTANQVADFRNQLEQGRQQRVFNATQAGQSYTSNLFNQFLGLVGGRSALGSSTLEPIRLATGTSVANAGANTGASQIFSNAAGFQAMNTSNQSANTGSLIDDAIQFAALFGGS